MFCRKCGKQIDNDSEFCTYCGSPIKTVVCEEENALEREEKQKADRKKSRMILISVISVLIVATIVALGMGVYLRSSMSQEKDEELTVGERAKELLEKETEEVTEVKKETKVEMVKIPIQPSPTLVPEKVKASLINTAPDISGYVRIPVIAANATSTIEQKGKSNDPMLLFDGKDDTNWQEGVPGYGIHESVSFSFDQIYEVKYMAFKLGNWKTDRYYTGNGKPKTMTLIFGDYAGQVTFTGKHDVEWVEVNKPVNADSMKLIIDDVYPGTNWEDTAITEITVYGK